MVGSLKTRYKKYANSSAVPGAADPEVTADVPAPPGYETKLKVQPSEAAGPITKRQAEQLQMWLDEGLEEPEAEFFASNPEMLDRPDIAMAAVDETHKRGHEPRSQKFYEATRENFDRLTQPQSISGASDEIDSQCPTVAD